MVTALDVICKKGYMEDHILCADLKSPPIQLETGYSWKCHLDELEEWGVVTGSPEADISFFCRYFAVPKTTTTCRSIFNGRPLGRHCKPPPPVNLPDVGFIIDILSKFFTKDRKVYGFVLDIRHWFHHIRVGDDLSRYFGLLCVGRFYRYKVLPMGWSHSPWVCQAIAWALVIKALSGTDKVVTPSFSDDSELPHHIPLIHADTHEKIGYIFLYYDNIGVFCEDAIVAQKFQAKLVRVFNMAEVTIKDGSLQSFDNESMEACRIWMYCSREIRSEDWVGAEMISRSLSPR
jgi:hypothetical protein